MVAEQKCMGHEQGPSERDKMEAQIRIPQQRSRLQGGQRDPERGELAESRAAMEDFNEAQQNQERLRGVLQDSWESLDNAQRCSPGPGGRR